MRCTSEKGFGSSPLGPLAVEGIEASSGLSLSSPQRERLTPEPAAGASSGCRLRSPQQLKLAAFSIPASWGFFRLLKVPHTGGFFLHYLIAAACPYRHDLSRPRSRPACRSQPAQRGALPVLRHLSNLSCDAFLGIPPIRSQHQRRS